MKPIDGVMVIPARDHRVPSQSSPSDFIPRTTRLSPLDVKSYNSLKDDGGFIGDRASKRAFRAIIEHWRKPLRDLGHDPFGDEAIDAITKSSSIYGYLWSNDGDRLSWQLAATWPEKNARRLMSAWSRRSFHAA
jgi:hypothetical protein